MPLFQESAMEIILKISPSGKVSLPEELLKDLMLEKGERVSLEKHDGYWVLTPADYRVYTDAQIARWANDGEWKPGEREAWLNRIKQNEAK
jgi:antitoxin component of MazEF toxin-antitoxin module